MYSIQRIIVYHCDNDVVDNQSVNVIFENGVTSTLTMSAFTKEINRETRIMGTRGELVGSFDENLIIIKSFFCHAGCCVFDNYAD